MMENKIYYRPEFQKCIPRLQIKYVQKEAKRFIKLRQGDTFFFISLCRTAPMGHGVYSKPVLLFAAKKGMWWCNSAIIRLKEADKMIKWLENPYGKLVLKGQKKYRRAGRYLLMDSMLATLTHEDGGIIRISIVRKYFSRKKGAKGKEQASITISRKEDLGKLQSFLCKMISTPNKVALLPRKWTTINREIYFEMTK
jgi:hypothetical protein